MVFFTWKASMSSLKEQEHIFNRGLWSNMYNQMHISILHVMTVLRNRISFQSWYTNTPLCVDHTKHEAQRCGEQIIFTITSIPLFYLQWKSPHCKEKIMTHFLSWLTRINTLWRMTITPIVQTYLRVNVWMRIEKQAQCQDYMQGYINAMWLWNEDNRGGNTPPIEK